MKSSVYFVICLVLFVVFLRLGMPIWFLFLVLTVYYGYRVVAKPAPASRGNLEKFPLGQLDSYSLDGDPSDVSYGLVTVLMGQRVFVDVKEDALIDKRRQLAMRLYEKRADLEKSLAGFLERNPEFRGRKVASIGLHSDEPERAEVFWDPDGYTLLRGLRFCDAKET